MTQPAYQYTQDQSLDDSYITFGGVNALKVASVANEFQRQKFQDGAVMSTYRGNAAVEVVVPDNPDDDSWGDGTDWSETTGGQEFVSIKGWDTASETAFIGEKSWVAAFDYHYYDGSHVTLNLGRYGTTSIGSSDEGRYATEDLYYAQKEDSQAGSKWGMPDHGKWPSTSIAQGGGATATVTVKNGAVDTIAVGDGGSGYTSAPTVTISDDYYSGGGSGATATAVLLDDAVSSITVTAGGSGYHSSYSSVSFSVASTDDQSDSKTWYAADGVSREVSYGGDDNQIALSGLVINDAIRQAGIPVTSDADILGCITPLSCYADRQLGDSYSFPVGNSFNFNNHAANMGIHVGRSATFNIWSMHPDDWDLSGSPTPKEHWASLEKTLGDSYTYHWGNNRTYAETSDGVNSIREGQGEMIEKLESKRTILNATNVTESATVGYNHEYESRLFDFSNSSIGQKYISSAAEYGLNLDISTGLGEQGALSVGGVGFSFKMPPPEATLGQFTMDISAAAVYRSEKLTITGLKNTLTCCLYLVETKVSAAETTDGAGAVDNSVSATPTVSTTIGPTVSTTTGGVAADATAAGIDSSLMSVGQNDSLNAKGTTTEAHILGINVGTTLAP